MTKKQLVLSEQERLVQTSTGHAVPRILRKRVETIIRKENLQKNVQQTVQRLLPEISEQVETQVREILRKAQIYHLDDVVQQTGQSSSAIQRVHTIVSKVVEKVVESQGFHRVVSEDVPVENNSPVSAPEIQTIVEKLRSKGVSRSLAERALQSLPTTAWTPDLIQQLVQENDSQENDSDEEDGVQQVQRRVQQQLNRLTGTTTHIFERQRLFHIFPCLF